jgi:hypothetical protein
MEMKAEFITTSAPLAAILYMQIEAMLTNVCRWYNLTRTYHRIQTKLCRKTIVIVIKDAIPKFQAWRRK